MIFFFLRRHKIDQTNKSCSFAVPVLLHTVQVFMKGFFFCLIKSASYLIPHIEHLKNCSVTAVLDNNNNIRVVEDEVLSPSVSTLSRAIVYSPISSWSFNKATLCVYSIFPKDIGQFGDDVSRSKLQTNASLLNQNFNVLSARCTPPGNSCYLISIVV